MKTLKLLRDFLLKLVYNVVLVSGVQQMIVIHNVYVYICVCVCILFSMSVSLFQFYK